MRNDKNGKSVVRCAVYTRKSSEEGLDMAFNSLDAQRESAEAYIAAQKHEGWRCLPQRYDDGGFTGGNLERPAMKRLLADIEAGKVDCVVVYKVDRLSRSLMDFARVMAVFENHKVAFVSVTQQFCTANSMGRLTLNVLLSFAQFEREIIGERIRDKIAAQRRKGKWTGGMAALGYDVDRAGTSPKLVVNAEEASCVRRVFALYLQHGALLPVVKELRRIGWNTKSRRDRHGDEKGGIPFTKATLHQLLTNPLYAGKIRHKEQVYAGEHEAIVDADTFQQVQTTLRRNGRDGGVESRNRHGALLKRLLRCKACGKGMTHTFTAKKGRRYRYYACVGGIQRGKDTCPSGSLPAAEIERVVVEQIACVGKDPALVKEVLVAARAEIESEMDAATVEKRDVQRELMRDHAELRKLAVKGQASPALPDLHARVERNERRLVELEEQLKRLRAEQIDEAEVKAALGDFGRVWEQLSPMEQAQTLSLLVAQVEWDAKAGTVAVSFHPTGIKALSKQSQMEEAA